jgi:hypothetical protein
MYPVVQVGSFVVGKREVRVTKPISESIMVTRDDVKRVVELYFQGKVSEEELSHWAGLILGISVYLLPNNDDDDDLLGLMTDLALPLTDQYLNRAQLKRRLDTI